MNTQLAHRSQTTTSTVDLCQPLHDVRTGRSGGRRPATQPGTSDAYAVVDLVTDARAGDQESWKQLVDRFLPLVTAIISKYRLSEADTDDVNQTVWLRLVEHLDKLREPRALPGWLATIARNESLQVIRLRSHGTPVDPATMTRADDAPELDQNLILEERAHALRDAMRDLTPQRRELLELLMADPPVPYDQISAILGIPIGSIGPTRARAIEQLRNARAIRALADGRKPGACY